MSIDRTLPLRRNVWEHLADSPYWITGTAIFVSITFDDAIGFWGALAVAVGIIVLAVLLLRPVARRSRHQRLNGNIHRGVVEAFCRFADDDDGRTPNHGWREGALHVTADGLDFQQLQGPGGKPLGGSLRIEHREPLGRRPYVPKQAVGMETHFAAFGFLVGEREFEVVLDPAYLKDPHMRFLLTGA